MYRVTTEDSLAEPFVSLIEAQEAHVGLVEQTRAAEAHASGQETAIPTDAAGELAELRELIATFEFRLAATGVRLPEGPQRYLAQSLLDFWALRQVDLVALESRLAPAKEQYPQMIEPATSKELLPYDPATAEVAAEDAERAFNALPDDAARDAARSGFLAVVQGAPVPAEAGMALDQFVAAGVLVRQIDAAQGVKFALAHEALPQTWPRLIEWQGQAARLQAELDRLRSSAQAWEATGSAAELPRGEAVKAAAELSMQDVSLKNYVDAAEAQRKRERTIAFIVVGAAIALLLYGLFVTGLSWSNWNVAEQFEVDRRTEQTEVIIAPSDETAPEDETGADTRSGSSGWIWLGSTAVPQIGAVEGGLLDPTAIDEGNLVRTLANLRVREAMPEDGDQNIAGERIGQVSGGVTIEILDGPHAVVVNGVEQYWAKVRVIPVVYFQFDQGSQLDLAELRQQLDRQGFTVPEAQGLPNLARADAGPAFDVRYYYEQDTEAARQVAQMVNRWLGDRARRQRTVPTSLVNSPLAERVKTGTIEVWLYVP